LPSENSRRERIEQWLEGLVILAALATIPVTYAQAQGSQSWLVSVGDWVIWVIFALEFVVLYQFAVDKRSYLRGNLLSIFIVVVSFPLLPNLLALARLIRLIRLVRVLRLVRLASVTTKGLHALRRIFGRQGVLFIGCRLNNSCARWRCSTGVAGA
jgi:hypothetical protein